MSDFLLDIITQAPLGQGLFCENLFFGEPIPPPPEFGLIIDQSGNFISDNNGIAILYSE
jgi:hypothetical protein